MLAVPFYARATDREFGFLTRDPATVLDTDRTVGLVTSLGVMLWAAAAGMAALTALVTTARTRTSFAAWSAITILLMFDDAFVIHEEGIPLLGVPQEGVFVFYIVVVAAGAVRLRPLLVSAGTFGLAAAAGALFAVSILEDVLHLIQSPSGLHILVEDGSKFVGIGCWTAATMFTAAHVLQEREPDASTGRHHDR